MIILVSKFFESDKIFTARENWELDVSLEFF
jgi:hypothetical protein